MVTSIYHGKHNTIYNYCLNDHRINVDHFINDFGCNLTGLPHIKKMVLKANSKLGIIRNTFHDLSK